MAKSYLACALSLLFVSSACDDDTHEAGDAGTDEPDQSETDASESTGAEPADCDGSGSEKAVCAAQALLDVLPSASKSVVNLAFSDAKSRTLWSNLPGQTRAGAKIGALDDASKAAALALMATVLSAAGDSDLTGVMNADDYLGSLSGGGGMGGMAGQYAASNYYVAVFGTPSTTSDWALTFGGHHMAFNLTWLSGVGYPTPHHIGVEPKASFTINGASFEPLSPEGAAFVVVFEALSSAELDSAYLSGSFSDVVIGPVEYNTGSVSAAKAKYPTGANRKGVLVSTLSEAQRKLVVAAIEQWVDDYDPSIADALLATYTSSSAFADTLVAWGGTKASGVDPDVNGTYMRIDGPRLWLELSCQAGVVVSGKSHFHTIFRDKEFDYAGTL